LKGLAGSYKDGGAVLSIDRSGAVTLDGKRQSAAVAGCRMNSDLSTPIICLRQVSMSGENDLAYLTRERAWVQGTMAGYGADFRAAASGRRFTADGAARRGGEAGGRSGRGGKGKGGKGKGGRGH